MYTNLLYNTVPGFTRCKWFLHIFTLSYSGSRIWLGEKSCVLEKENHPLHMQGPVPGQIIKAIPRCNTPKRSSLNICPKHSNSTQLTRAQNTQTSPHRMQVLAFPGRHSARGLSKINSLLVKKRGGKPRLLAQDTITSCISPTPWVFNQTAPG